LRQRLAHLERHRTGVRVFPLAQNARRARNRSARSATGRWRQSRDAASARSRIPASASDAVSSNVSSTAPVAGLIAWTLTPPPSGRSRMRSTVQRNPSGFGSGRPELVRHAGRHVHAIERRDVAALVTQHHAPATANHHHRVRMLVPLEGRVAAGLDLEIPRDES